jgi:hypothetical protein
MVRDALLGIVAHDTTFLKYAKYPNIKSIDEVIEKNSILFM